MSKRKRGRRRKNLPALITNNIVMKNIAFNADGTITVTNADDSTTVFSTSGTPVVAPTDTEIDVLRSDGTTAKFVLKG